MHRPRKITKPSVIIFVILLIGSVLLAGLVYKLVVDKQARSAPVPPPIITVTGTPSVPPSVDHSKVLGIEGYPDVSYQGISWVRIAYPSCGWGNLRGKVLQDSINAYHKAGVNVLLTVCQGRNNDRELYDTAMLQDAAQGKADAVQCGNEQMKKDQAVSFLYIPPERFARFYDLCKSAMHAVRPDSKVLLGSLDPHVGGIDYQPLLDQVQYLDKMQTAMNTQVHPGGKWSWKTEALGLIDSWHNGYPDESVNSLYGLFVFWAQQFHVNLDKGQLGKHLWVVEGTGCFKGCGIDENDKKQVAVSHVLTLITDVETAIRYNIPFFYFSGKDFNSAGFYWPIGILDIKGRAKPIRQDLGMGARTLSLTCTEGKVDVVDQLQLLARLYSGCLLPGNYAEVLKS